MFNIFFGNFRFESILDNIITGRLFDFIIELPSLSLALQFLILTFILHNNLSNPLLNLTTEENEYFVSIFRKVLPIYGLVCALVLLFGIPFC